MPTDPHSRKPLEHSLGRLEEALARSRESEALAARAVESSLATGTSKASVGRTLGVAAIALVVAVLIGLLATEGRAFLVPLAILIAVGLLPLLARRMGTLFSSVPAGASGGPRVGMGASVAADAVLNEGSVVEMGASIGAAAVLEQGAVVRMGASIGPRAVIERGATVSWGASVGEGACIGAGASVAAGSDVLAGARVPPRTRIAPGTTWTAAMSGANHRPLSAARDELESAGDPRSAHIAKACDRLEAEFARAPEPVRAMFGDSRATLTGLRRTCLDLLARERSLRAEASPEALARLEQEKLALEARLTPVTDEQVRRSLSGAVAAITAQQEQRRLFQNDADRLEAELTRLIWTVDGMGTELLRVRTAGAELYQGSASEIARSVQHLQDEIDNIALALEELNRSGGRPPGPATPSGD